MRKFWFYLLAIIMIAAAVAALFYARQHTTKHNDNGSTTTSNQAVPKKTAKNACTIFTLADAKQLLGDTAKGGSNPIFDSSTDFDVSTCTYTQDQGTNAPVSSKKTATLLLQAPKTATGIASNQKEFGPFKPTGAQDVSGYGDQAYWDAGHGQLNVIKNNVWYIISYGPSTPTDRTLDQAKQLADLLNSKL